ncbi:glycerophosphodiester phosphodiesterase [Rhabdothermincola salaria]|uniref:glycerophosphodiester phosphodiesterase n=1 Tax=Rhabdothermincola salaria TaxID=2903142 RepID=UPI001E543BA6|nr:glycerophosphodiester phosphodiesterase [Rhabdothermincola salaria]MCD9625098.1 glycerophosphodiester phosphodiesterase [Rhabdothermincola salaria]
MTLVIAHRGASSAHPPGNTVAAFRAARALGADWVELDVRPAADGSLVVHHDDRVPGGGLVAETESADLPEWVPTLADALDACAGMGVNVEIKVDAPVAATARQEHLVRATVAALDELDEPERFLVTSFDWTAAAQVAELSPSLPTGLLVFDFGTGPDPVAQAVAGGHRSINPWDPFVTPELVTRAHAAGIVVHPWTVDDPERMRDLVAMGVDGIITNVPDVARGVVDAVR